MKQLVIDASVILKWYLADEKYGLKAVNLLTEYIANELDITAPSLLEYEVVNGLIIAQKRGRIKDEKIRIAIDGFINLGIKTKSIAPVYSKILHYCQTYNCSAYDAAYLAVADDENITLITADEKLYNMVKKNLPWVKWLGE